MMPDRPWGIPGQLSSPFIYSGNWMATVYYDSAVILEINEPTAETPYSTYLCQWRVSDKYPDGKITVTPSDFATYKVGDRITLLKDIKTTKTSELWSDPDLTQFGDTWQAVPVSFYGLDIPAAGS